MESVYSSEPIYSFDEPSSKRLRTSGSRIKKPAAVDRITSLPASLLLHVLSFLPIEDAVKTQVLSRRWQHLWTYTPSLVFYHDSDSSSDKSVSDFVTFVDRILFLCNCSKLKKLVVKFAYEPDYASNVYLWTRFATGKEAEELQLDFGESPDKIVMVDNRYLLPQHLYTNSSFKALQFSMCIVMPKGVVCWDSLKKLSVGYAKLSDDVIQKILAGCPVLEILELYYFYGFNHLLVSNASLKKLILRDFWDHEYGEEDRIDGEHYSWLEISGPHLHSLEISGNLGEDCRLGDVSSLVDANLTFHMTSNGHHSDDCERYPNMLIGLLKCLVHVKQITLGDWTIQVLSLMEAKGLHSPRLKCEFLALDTYIRKSVLPGIAHMLEISPNLETLVISWPSSRCFEYFREKLCNVGNKLYRTSRRESYSFTCLISCLRKVEFIGLEPCKVNNYSYFVKFLLKNARVLQEMVINDNAQKRDLNWQRGLSRAAQKLLSFPRSSSNAVVLFYE